MAKEEIPRYGQKQIVCFRKVGVGFKYNLFSHNNDSSILKNAQIVQQLFQQKRKKFRSKRIDSKLLFPQKFSNNFFFFLVWQSVYIHTQQIKHLMTSQELHFFLFLALSLTQDVLNIITNFFAKDYRKQNEIPLKISNGVAQKMHFFPRLDCQFLMKIEG